MRKFATAGLVCMLASSSLAAQEKMPKRPALPPTADSCEAQAYFQAGVKLLAEQPDQAADAFFWAGRLDPTWPDALYARRVALLMTKPYLLQSYVEGNRRVIESPKIQAIDSLQYRAFQLNPFVFRSLERRMLLRYALLAVDAAYRENMSNRRASPLEADIVLTNWLHSAEPENRAWAAYLDGRFGEAAAQYGEAMKNKKNAERSWLHAERARAFFGLGQMDSARAEINQAIARLREKDQKKLVFVYESKALYEQGVGLTYELAGDYASAREAYGRALQEDMSYYPAHVRSAVLAMAKRDTAAAVAAIEMALQIKPDDPTVLYRAGELLLASGHQAEGEEALRKLERAEPYFAQPYRLLARSLEAQGKKSEAAAQYRAYLERTWRSDSNRIPAEAALRTLGTGSGTW